MLANPKRWVCVMALVAGTAGVGLPLLAWNEAAAAAREHQAQERAQCFLVAARREEALVEEARLRHRAEPYAWSTNFWMAFRLRRLHTATERLVEELGEEARSLVQTADLHEAERYAQQAARLALSQREREVTRTILAQIAAC